MVLDKLEAQIKKSKEKTRERRTGSKFRDRGDSSVETFMGDDEAERQVKIKNIEYKPMDIDEAVMQMDIVDDNFLVFTNSRTERINVLYRRKDGHYGLIQPS